MFQGFLQIFPPDGGLKRGAPKEISLKSSHFNRNIIEIWNPQFHQKNLGVFNTPLSSMVFRYL